MKNKIRITTVALMTAFTLTACGGAGSDPAQVADDGKLSGMPEIDTGTDIDLDALNASVDNIKNLDLSGTDSAKEDKTSADAQEPEGDVTKYSYVDATRSGSDLTLVPNGGMDGSTVLYGDKDLNGFLDYIDSSVLEKGRTINRDLFYDLLATMLVDKDLNTDFSVVEKHMIMALAVANNFHDTDVSIRDCYLDANNAMDYHYHVTMYGKDDTWLVNYGDRTFYMNDGATEYVTDMFKDDYLAIWWMSADEYYGVDSLSQ
jgi:predicted small lipoprotein YifL